MASWKYHPFAVEAYFDHSVVLTYAVPRERLEGRLPPPLDLDAYDDPQGCPWAFVAVALVRTRDLRPKGLPALLGQDFFLVGYRVFVRYVNRAGRRLRGLYILRSATDRRRMQWLGNLFTHYGYVTTDVAYADEAGRTCVESHGSGLRVVVGDVAAAAERDGAEPPLPAGSPFPDWRIARRYASPLPFTFSWRPGAGAAEGGEVVIVEGVRREWQPAPVPVIEHRADFLDTLDLGERRLASAFEVRRVPYWWRPGVVEPWSEATAASQAASASAPTAEEG